MSSLQRIAAINGQLEEYLEEQKKKLKCRSITYVNVNKDRYLLEMPETTKVSRLLALHRIVLFLFVVSAGLRCSRADLSSSYTLRSHPRFRRFRSTRTRKQPILRRRLSGFHEFSGRTKSQSIGYTKEWRTRVPAM